MKTVQTSSIYQQGSTLIEILVSMFILALGLMALIAMQTRTSIGIKEAENQTIIAQATENLAENMMTNPILDVNTNLETTKSYVHYDASDYECPDTPPAEPNPPVGALTNPKTTVAGSTGNGRTDLAEYHMGLFHSEACKIQGVEKVSAKVIKTTDVNLLNNGQNLQTLRITWKMSGSSDKEFTYDYPLDDN